MTNEAPPDDRHKGRSSRIEHIFYWFAAAAGLLSLCCLFYALVQRRRLQAHSRSHQGLRPLPQRPPEPQLEDQNAAGQNIALQEVVTNPASPRPASEHTAYGHTFLGIPAEIRIEIYSYLLPDTQTSSTSRALRATCRLINHEVEHEVRNAFVNDMIFFQKITSPYLDYFTVFYSTANYHVEIILQLPQLYYPPSATRFMPLATTPLAITLVEDLTLRCLESLRWSTRSVTVTLQPHTQGLGTCFERHFNGVWSVLYDYLHHISGDILIGKTDLRQITVLSGGSIMMVPEVRYARLICTLKNIDVLGIGFRYDHGRQSAMVLDERHRGKKLVQILLKQLPHRARLYIRYKRD